MSYKKKNIILIISFLTLLSFIYVFNVSKTLSYKKKLSDLLQEKEKINNSTVELKLLKEKSIYLDSILQQENISVTNSFQQIILKKINEFKKENKIELIEFNTSINVLDNNTNTQLYPLIIKGNFNELLSFLNYIEQQGLGEIKNIDFLKKKDYRIRKNFLLLKLYIKKIVSKKLKIILLRTKKNKQIANLITIKFYDKSYVKHHNDVILCMGVYTRITYNYSSFA